MFRHIALSAVTLAAGAVAGVTSAASWESIKNVEFIVPAGIGGGAD